MKRTALLLGAILAMTACHPSTPPASKMPFGIAIDGDPSSKTISAFKDSTGIAPRFVVVFQSWPSAPAAFQSPRPAIDSIRATGAVPVLTWEPWDTSRGPEPSVIPAADIFDGKWDAYIDRWLGELKASGTEVWVRFAHEMNTTRYHWGVADAARFGPDAPFLYRRMFRHVVGRARTLGAHNIKWVFCPNSESVPNPRWTQGASWNRASRYYPGDEYVDILGMDGYNWGDTIRTADWKSSWQSFEQIFAPLRSELLDTAKDRPLFVFETACANTGGDKNLWIRAALETARAWHLAGISWFDVNKDTDWRLSTGLDAGTAAAIRSLDVALPPSPKTGP